MKNLLAALAVGLASLFSALPSHAITLSILPSVTNVNNGDSFYLDVSISGLSAANEIVSAYDINLLYNPAILSVNSVTFYTGPLGGVETDFGIGEPDGTSPVAGNIGFWLYSLLNTDAELITLQQGVDSLLLAKINWTALADGSTTVAFGSDPDFDYNVIGLNAGTLPVTLANACVNVGTGSGCTNNVPEPGTLFLLSGALLGLVYRRQARR